MKILFDHQIFTFQNYGGISRIYTELYKCFKNNPEVDIEMPIRYSNNFYLEELGDFKYKNLETKLPAIGEKLLMKLTNDFETYKALIKKDFDIFHPTYFDPYFLPLIKEKPFVLDIHDMTHEFFPEGVSFFDRTIQWKKKLAFCANHIIAVSENTKKDIINLYGVDKNKITVVYNATSISAKYEVKVNDLPSKYILFVGNRKGYKNFKFFVKGASSLLKKDKNLHLICAGGGEFSLSESDFLESLGIKDRIRQIFFKNDKELAYIYSHALCFVFPSKYEGFGIPVLEAFNCNCPVCISDASCFPEIVEDAGLYFNPEDINSLISVLERIVKDELLRKILINKGKHLSRKYSWKKTAEGYLNVYKKVLEK